MGEQNKLLNLRKDHRMRSWLLNGHYLKSHTVHYYSRIIMKTQTSDAYKKFEYKIKYSINEGKAFSPRQVTLFALESLNNTHLHSTS